MRKIICAVLLSILLISFTSVITDAADSVLHKMLQDAWARVDTASVHDIKKMVGSKEEMVLLDVRDSEEYKNEHITGAINISRGMLEFMI